jgi:ketosteroid isomerase-like protein
MKYRRSIQPVILYTSLLAICISANAQDSADQDIRRLRERSNDAIARHDTASLGRFWLDDVHVLTSRSTSLAGKLANQRAFQLEFQTKEKLLYVRTPRTVEAFPDWNMAAEYGTWKGSWISNGTLIRIGGSYYAKWHKVKGEWKIKAEVFTPNECDGGDHCKELAGK